MKKSIIAVIVLAVIGIAGWGFYNLVSDSSNASNTEQVATGNAVQQTANEITFSEDGKTVSYAGEEGVTALATLESLATVTTEDSSFGTFVTGINGVAADSLKEYWSFYVNGQYANEGAGTYQAKAGDIFKWQLEQLQ